MPTAANIFYHKENAVDPVNEASQIFTRLFEALARRSGKTLNVRSRADITRACELLSHAGQELDDLLDDMPPPRPVNDYATVSFEKVPPEVRQWREQRER
jgi:hypothetical protein